MTRLLFILTFLISLNSNAYVNGDHGAQAPNSVVGLQGNGSACSGVKVAPNAVLTARHCLVIAQGQEIEIQTKEGERGGARTLIRHPLKPSVPDGDADIALIYVDKEIKFQETNNPGWTTAKVSVREVQTGDEVYLGGFGCESDMAEPPPVDKYGKPIPQPPMAFSGSFKNVGTNSRGEFQFGSQNSDGTHSFSCPGDSGGPIFRIVGGQESVVGIIITIGTTSFYGQKIVNDDGSVLAWLQKELSALSFSED